MSHEPLSAAGATRRDAMLDELLDSMRDLHATRRRRRRVTAATGSGLAVVLVAIAAWRSVERPPTVPESPVVVNRTVLEVEYVSTDPGILARCRPATTFTAEVIDDDALLEALRAMNRPTGLVRIGGEVRLTEHVTDL